MSHKEKGNVLFLILIAVALFAALSYAITSSTKGGGDSGSAEKNRAAASAILSYFASFDAAAMRMSAAGIKPENISFEMIYKPWGQSSYTVYTNANCTSTSCRFFHPQGGGLSPPEFLAYGHPNPPGWAVGYGTPGTISISVIPWPNAGTSQHDLVVQVQALKASVCEAMNKILEMDYVTASGTAPLITPVSGWDTATFAITSDQTQLYSKNTFTRLSAMSSEYCHVYHLFQTR